MATKDDLSPGALGPLPEPTPAKRRLTTDEIKQVENARPKTGIVREHYTDAPPVSDGVPEPIGDTDRVVRMDRKAITAGVLLALCSMAGIAIAESPCEVAIANYSQKSRAHQSKLRACLKLCPADSNGKSDQVCIADRCDLKKTGKELSTAAADIEAVCH